MSLFSSDQTVHFRRSLVIFLAGLWVVLFFLPVHPVVPAPPPSETYLQKKFQELDRNQDGRLSREEYLTSWSYDRKLGEQRFKEVDRNGDGFITLEEYLRDVQDRWKKKPANQPGKP